MTVTIKMSVRVSLTANQWELYTCSMKCGTAARGLNAAATKAINEAHKSYQKDRDVSAATRLAWSIWHKASDKFSKYGADDSEPRWHFEDLLVKHFHKPLGLEY